MRAQRPAVPYLSARPSKVVFRRHIVLLLARCEPFEAVLDVASAGAKNRDLFRGKAYHGADIDAALIEAAGTEHAGDPNVHLYVSDLRSPTTLPSGPFPLVVSTFTLQFFEVSEAEHIVRELAGLIVDGGHLVCTLPADYFAVFQHAELEAEQVVRFRRAASRTFERLLQRAFGTDHLPGASGRLAGVPGGRGLTAVILVVARLVAALDRFGTADQVLVRYRRVGRTT